MEQLTKTIRSFVAQSDNLSPEELRREVAYPLTDKDLSKIIQCPIYTYPDLQKFKSIEELFTTHPYCFLLYLTNSMTSGHWVCLLKHHHCIEFFDPLSGRPDDQRKLLSKYELKKYKQNIPILTTMLKNSPYPIQYNGVKLQRDTPEIKDCGRHCASRLLFHDIDLSEYLSLIQMTGIDPDVFCVLTTREYL